MGDRRSPAAAPIRQMLVVTVLVVAISIGVLPLSGVIAWATPLPADSTLHELPTLEGEHSQNYVVNQDERVGGTTQAAAGVSHAFLWHDGAMSELGTLGGPRSGARRTGVLEDLVRGYAATFSERNRSAPWRSTATVLLAALARRAETETPFATPVAGATPVASASQSGNSFVWDQVDVTVELRNEGSFHVTERDRVAFSGGPFRTGYREIPLARIEEIDNIRVGAVEGDHLQPFRYVVPSDFTASTPNTYTAREISQTIRIDWSFPQTTSQSRTFQVEYAASGALRVYDEAEPPYQQISWIGVDRELTKDARVNAATLTFVLPRPVAPGQTHVQGPGGDRPEDHTSDGQTWTWTASNLGPGDSLVASLQFPPLVQATKPIWQDASDHQEQGTTGQQSLATPSVNPTSTPSDLMPPSGTGTPAASPVASAIPIATPAATPLEGTACRDVMRSDFNGKTRDLLADCTTDRPIFVPEAWVFNGGGHTIFAIDPDDGRLTGGVIMVTGASGTVRHVTIDGAGLTAGCVADRGQTALTGVVFRGASGEVSGVTVRNLARALPATTEQHPAIAESVRASCGAGIAVLGRDAIVVVNENVIENVGYVGVLVEIGQASISHTMIDRAADAGILAGLGAHVRISPGNQIRNANVGIQLEGEGTGGRVAGNTIERMALMGVAISSGAQASVVNNSIADTTVNGIAIEGSTSEATVENNHLDEPGDVGIKALGRSAEIRDNTVTGGTFGIGIGGGGTAQVIGNTVSHAEDTGIYVLHEGTTATIDGNTIADAASDGIWVQQNAHATITGNTVTDAKNSGITAVAGAAVEISGENVVRGGERGIAIGGAGTTGTVTGNRVEGAGVVGITIHTGAMAREVSGNTVVDAQFGITTLGAGTSATVADNSVSQLEATGYTVESGATAELRHNRVTQANLGIFVGESGTTAELSENRIEETTTAGIVLATGSQTTATSNTLRVPGIDGIRVTGAGTTATVRDTAITGAAETGIEVEDGAQATIADGNQVSGGQWGISVLDAGTSATVHGNDVSGVANQGISVLYGARATVSNNAITGGATGILVRDRGFAIVEGNTIRDVTSAGISFEHTPAPAATTPAGTSADAVAIVSDDIFFDPTTVTIPANTDVTVVLPNQGAVPHNFSIDELGISVDLAPGATEEIVINAPAGEYAYYCNVPGHKEAGMVGTLIVAKGDASADVEPETGDTIRRNTVSGGRFGIVVTGPWSPVVVAENTLTAASTAGISIENGAEADVEGNAVVEATTGINIALAGTSATLTGNRVTDTSERGIHVTLGADALLRKNTVTRAGTSGIAVGGSGTTAALEGNIVSNAFETGIAVELAATATIDKGNFVSGGKWGISIFSAGTTAEVRGNRVRNTSNQGIVVTSGAQATIADNQVTGGDAGIYLRSAGTTATVTGNWLSNPVNYGIEVVEGATAERIDGNTITDSGDKGIYLASGASADSVADNRISGGRQGITVWGGTIAERIDGNIVTGSSVGILVGGAGTSVAVRSNRIGDIGRTGVEVRDGAAAEVIHNAVTKMRYGNDFGILVTGRDTSATVEGNTLADVGFVGIQFSQGAHGTVKGNRLTGVTDSGIRLIDAETVASVIGNTVRDAGVIGIEARARQVTITDNIIEDSRQVGIQLGPDADVEVTGNTITGPDDPEPDRDGPYGIRVLRGVSGTIASNQVANHGNPDPAHSACGIVIDAKAPGVVVSQNQFPGPGNEVDMCDERPRLPAARLASTVPSVTATPVAATPVAVASPVPAASPRATPVPAATPIATPATTPDEFDRDIAPENHSLLELLPTQDQVPAGLIQVDEAERSKGAIAPALSATPVAASGGGNPVYETIISGAGFSTVYVTEGTTPGVEVVAFELQASAASTFYEYTSSHVGQPMSIVIGKQAISSPKITGAISTQGIIEGIPPTEVDDLAIQLKAGVLAVPLVLVESRIVPTVAAVPTPVAP